MDELLQADLFITAYPVDQSLAYLRLKDGTLLRYAGRLPRHSSLEKEVNDGDIGVAYHCDLEGILYWVAIPPHSDASAAYEFMLEDTPHNIMNAQELLRDKAALVS